MRVVVTSPGPVGRRRILEKLGCKAQDTSELFFTDLRVPIENLLGEEGAGFAQLMTQLSQERLIQAIRAIASCAAALSWTINYVSEREMFSHILGDFQNTRFQLAELHAEIMAQQIFIDRCTELHLSRELDATDAVGGETTVDRITRQGDGPMPTIFRQIRLYVGISDCTRICRCTDDSHRWRNGRSDETDHQQRDIAEVKTDPLVFQHKGRKLKDLMNDQPKDT